MILTTNAHHAKPIPEARAKSRERMTSTLTGGSGSSVESLRAIAALRSWDACDIAAPKPMAESTTPAQQRIHTTSQMDDIDRSRSAGDRVDGARSESSPGVSEGGCSTFAASATGTTDTASFGTNTRVLQFGHDADCPAIPSAALMPFPHASHLNAINARLPERPPKRLPSYDSGPRDATSRNLTRGSYL